MQSRLTMGMVFAAVVSTASPVWAQEATTWGNAELDAYILANRPQDRAAAVAADPFAAPAAIPDPASTIHLVYEVAQAGTGSSAWSPTWKYDVETGVLTLSQTRPLSLTQNISWQGREPQVRYSERPVLHNGFMVFREVTESDGGPASNAYGATVNVTIVKTVGRGIAELAPFEARPGPSTGNRYSMTYEHTMTISPDEGRALVPHLRLEVIARPKPWSPGRWVLCSTSYDGATIRHPTTSVGDYCYVTTEVMTIRFVDSRDGTVLRQWNR